MPRKPIDYSKTIIYKFVCKDLDVKDLYVGHSTNWIKRKNTHKNACINSNCKSYNCKVYKIMRENGGWDNWEMIEIEKYPCNDEREACSRERYWYEQLSAELNTYRPLLTEEEIKEYKKIKNEEWNEKNKERRKEYDRIRESTEYRKEYKKEYRNKPENKKKAKEHNKQYNKEKISCICGSICGKGDIRRHERSQKHIQFMKTITIEI